MGYWFKVGVMFRFRKTPFPFLLHPLKLAMNSLVLLLSSFGAMIWGIACVLLSPIRWLVEPLWIAYSKKDDEVFWSNMISITERKKKRK